MEFAHARITFSRATWAKLRLPICITSSRAVEEKTSRRSRSYDWGAMSAPHQRIEVLDEEMAATLRLKTGAERLAIASRMFSSARRMLLSHLRASHPDWDQRQVEQEAARRLSHGAL